MNKKILWAVVSASIMTACGPVHNNQALDRKSSKAIHALAVQMESKEGFEVYMSRATQTNAGAAMFGLVGAAIESGMNASSDSKKTDQLLPRLVGLNHSEDVTDGLYEGLKQRDSLKVVESTDADGVLEMTIRDWGLKVTDKRYESSLTPFVEVKCVLRAKNSRDKLMDTVETYYGNQSHQFHQYSDNENLLKDELHQVLHKAGVQIGTKLAYTLGGNS